MSSTLRLFSASAFIAVSLVSCSGEPDAAPVANLSGPVEIEQLLAVLPDEIVASYDEVSYNDRTGETVFSNLRFSAAEDAEVGIIIKDLSVSGVDTEFLLARLNGSNFDQQAIIVDQLEANDISMFGVEKFYGDFFDAYNDKVQDFVEELNVDENIEAELGATELQKLNFQIDNVSLDDFELRPFILVKRTLADETDSEFFGVLQAYAAYNRAIGAKRFEVTGIEFDMAMAEAGEVIDMSFNIGSSITQDWAGGDIGKSVTSNMIFDMSVPIPEEGQDEDLPFESMEMSGSYGLQMVESVRLDKALGWLARGEMPPTTETDLMSLGVWTARDQTFSIFGKPFYSIESSVTDMSQFHWFIPTNLTSKTENFVFDMGAFVETILEVTPEIGDDPEFETMLKAMTVLEEYDLSAYSMDFDFGWSWEPDAGPAGLSVETGLDGYGTMAFDLSGALGGFNDWVATVEAAQAVEGGDDGEAFEAFATKAFAFNGASFKMNDRGGNQRVFNLVGELAELLKDENSEWAAIAAYDEETMKLLVSSTIKGGAEFAASELPAVRDYAKALADYLTEGGTFEVALQPEEPIRLKTLRKMADIDNPEEGKAFLEQLGFSVAHDASPGGE